VISASMLLYLLCGFGLDVIPFGFLFCNEGSGACSKKNKANLVKLAFWPYQLEYFSKQDKIDKASEFFAIEKIFRSYANLKCK
jgi:hypothetical protein